MGETVKKSKAFAGNFIFCCRLLYRSGRSMVVSAFLTDAALSVLPFVNFWLVKYLTDSLLALIGGPGRGGRAAMALLMSMAGVKMASGFLEDFAGKLRQLQMERLLAYINVSTMEKSVGLDISYFDIPENIDDLNRSRQNAHSLHEMVFAVGRVASDTLALVLNFVLAAGISPVLCAAVILCALPQYFRGQKAEGEMYGFEKSQYR